MKRRSFLKTSGLPVMVSALWPFETWSAKTAGSWDNLVADLTKLIPQLMQEAVLPGLSVAIVRDGKVFWERGFGVKNAQTREAVDHNTIFEAASVSKTVFAYFALKQCEKGVIGLDVPLSKYMSTATLGSDPQLALITARHVLSHTTGFQNTRSGDQPLKVHFKPDSRFDYSGEGYWFLQSVLTHLTGHEDASDCAEYEAGMKVCATDFDAAIKQNLLVPFGLKTSGYLWNEDFARTAASPHDVAGKAFDKSRPKAPDVARYASMGGLHTSCSDYAKFLIEVIDPKPADAFRLDKKTYLEMIRPQVKLKEGEKIDGADAWALGWAVQQRKTGDVILHSGGQQGFRSLTMGSVQRKSGFVMFTNGDNGGKVLYHPQLGNLLNTLLPA